MAEHWFYHLERAGVDDVVPELLSKVLGRGGRALVMSPEETRLERLDAHLWTFREDSFLPHGRTGRPHAPDQPVLLSEHADNINEATMLFCLDGAEPGDLTSWERVIVMFEAADAHALGEARKLWKACKGGAVPVSYWRQAPTGRWEKQA